MGLYAVRRPIAKQPLVTIFSAVARKSHAFLFVSRAMESLAIAQIILVLRTKESHIFTGMLNLTK
jgi:hypothetical protein